MLPQSWVIFFSIRYKRKSWWNRMTRSRRNDESGGSRNFRTGGGGGSRMVLFNTPSVKKFMPVLKSKFTTTTLSNSHRGTCARCVGPRSNSVLVEFSQHKHSRLYCIMKDMQGWGLVLDWIDRENFVQ